MVGVKNKVQLVMQGESKTVMEARALTLECFEYVLNAVDPKTLTRSKMKLAGSVLQVENFSFDLDKFRHIYIVGGGKAGGGMAQALEEVLDSRITAGTVNIPYGSAKGTCRVALHEASHPVPDESGVEGVRRMVALVEQAEENDLVICLLSGGGSSLMPLPREGVTLRDKRELTSALLKSGAAINEVNAVRKHLSCFKGGWLAKAAYPALILNLVLSDVIGDPLDVIASGPTAPDTSTFAEAKAVLEKYGLWLNASEAVRRVLEDGVEGRLAETPKAGDEAFSKVHNVVVGNNSTAINAASKYLKAKGLNTLLLPKPLDGEAQKAGAVVASVAREVIDSGRPVRKPAGIVAGGETTVTVKGQGKGGRNQELTLSAALALEETANFVLASLSTDGVDGPTDAAGAVIDASTLKRAKSLGLKPEQFLADNNSYNFFQKLGELVFTGQTGTNVNDISVFVVL